MRLVRPRIPTPLLRLALPSLLSLLSLGCGVANAAEFTAGASASGQTATKNVQQGSDPRSGSSPVWAGADATVRDAVPGVLQNAEGVGYASASYGHIVFVSRAATTQTSVSGDQPGLHAESYASASMADSFVVSCPTCVTGTRGSMNFRVVLEGDVGLNNSSTNGAGQQIPGAARTTQYSWSSNLSMRAEGVAMDFPGPGTLSLFAYDFRAMVNDDIVSGGSREGMGIYDYSLEFEFGAPIHMNWLASASSSADLRAGDGNAIGALSAMGYAAFSNSFYWDGISAVTDANGNLVSAFTAKNGVGVDYAQSFANAALVPEPGAWALMAVGLVMLGLIARRQHPRRVDVASPRRRSTTGVAALLATCGGLLGAGETALAQEPPIPFFGVTYNYDLEAPGASRRSIQGGGATTLGEVRRFDDAIGFNSATLSSDARVEGWGAARYGHLQAFAKGSTSLAIQAAEQGTTAYGTITSTLTDSFVIQCGTCVAGTLGSMTFRVIADAVTSRSGGLDQPPGGSGFYMADTNWTTSLNLSAAGVPDPPPQPPDGWVGPNPGQLWQTTYRLDKLHNGEHSVEEMTRGSSPSSEMAIQFVFGQPIRLDMSLMAGVLGAAFTGQDTTSFSGHGAMETDATRSMYWDGITSVLDAQGNLVNGFTALNGAGVDYARSFATAAVVPEPGTWALMAVGLAMLGLIVRRRHAQRARPPRDTGVLLMRLGGVVAMGSGLALGASGIAQAQPFDANYSYTLGAPGATGKNESGYAFPSPGEVIRFSDAIGFSGASLTSAARVEGWASARIGHLQAYAKGFTSLEAQGAGQGTYITGDINISAMDDFVIQCSTCAAGTVGSMNFRVFFDGSTARTGGLGQPLTPTGGYMAVTDWWAGFGINARGVPGPLDPGRLEFQFFRTESLQNGVGTIEESPGVSAGLQQLSIPFVFGEPIHLVMGLSATLSGGVNTGADTTPFSGQAAMETDATRSMYWDGITSVLDAQGKVVDGFTALNASGIDYARSFATAAAVPEPGTWALMAAGLALLVVLRGRRGRGIDSASRQASSVRLVSPRRLPLRLLVLAMAWPAMASAAETFVSTNTRVLGPASEEWDASIKPPWLGPVSSQLSVFDAGPGHAASGQMRTWGQARPGEFEMSVSGAAMTAANGEGSWIYAEGNLSGYTIDRFVVTCPTCVAGTRGSLTLQIQVDADMNWSSGALPGSINPVHGGTFGWGSYLQTYVDGIRDANGQPIYRQLSTVINHELANGVLTTRSDGDQMPGLQSLTMDFIFGQPVEFVWNVSMGVIVGSGHDEPHDATSWASIALSMGPNDTYWRGITSVLDSNGASVAGYRALNADGVDFAQSLAVAVVPEAGTWALMLGGLALLGVLARRRIPAPRRPTTSRAGRLAAAALSLGTLGTLGMGAASAATFNTGYLYSLRAAGTPDQFDMQGGLTSPDLVRTVTASGGTSNGALSSQADFFGRSVAHLGFLQSYATASASLSAQAPGQEAFVQGSSSASVSDAFTVACASCQAGTIGTISLRFAFYGSTARDASLAQPAGDGGSSLADTAWSTGLLLQSDGAPTSLDRSFYLNETLRNGVTTTSPPSDMSPGVQTLTFQFVFGQEIRLSMSQWAGAMASVNSGANTGSFAGASQATTDLWHTTFWDGIAGLTDANGQQVDAFTALNSAGIDYRLSLGPVPEPGTWALMALGLLAMGVLTGARAARSQGLPALRG